MAKIYWKISSTTLYLRNNSATGYSAWTESENAYPAWATDTNRNKIVTINIQNSITPTYFYRWFYNFAKLQTITNWNNLKLTNITDMSNTFEGCTAFNQEITIPNGVTNMRRCFKGCTKFNQPIEIPSGVTDMSNTFEGCTAFNQEITIPNGVTNMSYCFKNCTSFLQPITIPNGVTNMSYCFSNCTNFNQPITIPNSVTIMQGCFSNCTNFNQPITIPNSVTYISFCFYGCTSLNNIITINNLTLLAENTNYYQSCFYNTTQKIILCCDYRIDSTMKDTLNAIAATANNNNVQVGELSITVVANRDNINTTNANVQVTITRFRGNNEVINAIDIYKDDSSTSEIVTWSPSDMRMDTAVKTFTTTMPNINEAKTVQLKVIARDDFSDSAPQYATVATNFYTMDVLAGGKEISFGTKAVQDDLYESIQDETVPTFETNKFYERVVNSETGYNSYILLETEPDDWGTNWNDYYVLVHEDGLFKCAMDAQFNNNVSVTGDININKEVIWAHPDQIFIIEPATISTTSVSANSNAEFTLNVSKTGGYYPVGVVGFSIAAGSLVARRIYIDTQAVDSCQAVANVRNVTSNTAGASTITLNILWVKTT